MCVRGGVGGRDKEKKINIYTHKTWEKITETILIKKHMKQIFIQKQQFTENCFVQGKNKS